MADLAAMSSSSGKWSSYGRGDAAQYARESRLA